MNKEIWALVSILCVGIAVIAIIGVVAISNWDGPSQQQYNTCVRSGGTFNYDGNSGDYSCIRN